MPGGVADASTPLPADAPRGFSPRSVITGAAAALAVVLYLGLGTATLPLMDRDEPRFAEASREMLASGDWIVPRLNGNHRFDKPPLIYWMQAACLRVLGPTELATRLPSVACAALTALVTGLWATRMAHARAGLLAAAILLTCPQFYVHAHLAVADMAMILCFVIASWCGWELLRPGRGRLAADGWFWGLVVALGMGFLAKGPVAWLPVVPLAWARRQMRAAPARPERARAWEVAVALVAVLGIVGAWGIPALAQTRGEYWNVGMGKHVVARSVGVMEGHGLKGWLGYLGSLPFYVLAFPLGFLPWSPLLLRRLCLQRPWRDTSIPIHARYLLGGAALVFVVFTLVRTKLPHYTLPAFPLLAVWLAVQLDREGIPARRLARIAGGAALVLALLAGVILPWVSSRLVARELQRVATPLIRPGCAVATVGFGEPSVYWYLRPDDGPWVRHLADDAEAEAFLRSPGPRLVVVSDPSRADALAARVPGLKRANASGWSPVNGRRVGLSLLAGGEP